MFFIIFVDFNTWIMFNVCAHPPLSVYTFIYFSITGGRPRRFRLCINAGVERPGIAGLCRRSFESDERRCRKRRSTECTRGKQFLIIRITQNLIDVSHTVQCYHHSHTPNIDGYVRWCKRYRTKRPKKWLSAWRTRWMSRQRRRE